MTGAIILPAYNEETILERNVNSLLSWLDGWMKGPFIIIISDNDSTDKTAQIAERLVKRDKRIKYLHVKKKGRGVAIKAATQKHACAWYAYIDVDLPVGFTSLKRLIKSIESGKYDFVSGTRHNKGGKLIASPRRVFVSRCYLLLARMILGNHDIKDIQLGFKAWNTKVKREIFPLCTDDAWFFDTQLTHHAFRKKMRVQYIPVTYRISDDGRKSSVKLASDAYAMIKSLIRLRSEGR